MAETSCMGCTAGKREPIGCRQEKRWSEGVVGLLPAHLLSSSGTGSEWLLTNVS
jgi:hypothetical protein